MSSNTNSSILSKCAACGKSGNNLKVCTSCEQVSYCNAKCRNSHRSKHKKECKKYAAEVRNKNAALRAEIDAISEKLCSNEISDEELFADPPPKDDCDICFLLPHTRKSVCGVSTVYQPCCGKRLCYGCALAETKEMENGNLKGLCSFCRVSIDVTYEEEIQRVKKRMQLNDAAAFRWLGNSYIHGRNGLPQDRRKAFELFNRGAELGSVTSHCLLAKMYQYGDGVEQDEEKAKQHFMLAAMGGFEVARNMLGVEEFYSGNMDRAVKHFMIAARCGHKQALEAVREGYKDGHVTKDEYADTLRAHRASQDEMKSEQRTIAARTRREETLNMTV